MGKPNPADGVKALSLVGPIITAYNAAEKAGATALTSALECGNHLNTAMEAVGNRKWKQWREEHLSSISEETERLYRRLAVAASKKEGFFADCRSIRDAIKHLSGFDKDLNPRPPKPPHTGSGANGPTPTSTDTGGLEGELRNADADEIISGLGHDADKIADLAVRSIASLSPEKVCDALKKAWTKDQFDDLIKRVNSYLSTLRSIPPENELVAPSASRRL
jgi:hypothetical protein